ncbi:MAG: hypothetical protein H0X30_36150 [Anaerolineae bacterium]|nr:hypothetical protein [Anaerolineae bacterium]
MKRQIILIAAPFILLVTLAAVFASTHVETPNDPRTNPDANACYTGGSLAGKCKLDDQLWIAGWYEIRLEYGLITRGQFPDPYKWLLSDPPEDATADGTRIFPTGQPPVPTSPPITPSPTPTAGPTVTPNGI